MSEHLSYEGQSKIDYCLECAVKHSQTMKVLMKEGVQRAEADGPETEGVKEKIRGVVEELMGIENDTNTVTDNENVIEINTRARELWKKIYASKAEIGGADIATLRELKEEINVLVDDIYRIREEQEECPTCKVDLDLVKVQEKQPEKKEEEKPKSVSDYGKEIEEKRRKFIEEIRRTSES